LLGDELDGPRGRIYLIKQLLEGNAVSEKTQMHLDRCLTCRACETTCPSGVQYHRLLDIGRDIVEQQVERSTVVKFKRYALRKLVPYPGRFGAIVKLGGLVKPLLPDTLQNKMPEIHRAGELPSQSHERKMLVLEGCAQSVVTPNVNAATARVLDKLGIQLLTASKAGCCGAVSHHLSAEEEGLDFMRRNIDAWWPLIEQQDIEAIVITATGCGVMVKEYGHLLQHDAAYAEKARRISVLARDISEILRDEDLDKFSAQQQRIAFHSPCTLQHGQQLDGVVESILAGVGYDLVNIEDAHLCCGSAGTYSVLQPELSEQILSNKVSSLEKEQPDVIATANIGCQMHLATKAGVPVVHWVELIEKVMI
jgi:glycolate oxidase iron-sulfur subunit